MPRSSSSTATSVRILLISILVSFFFSSGAFAYQSKVEKGDISEIAYRPFVYINVEGYHDLDNFFRELRKDPNGQLVAVTEAHAADFVIAFMPDPIVGIDYGNLDPSKIGAGPKGFMIAYTRPSKERIRIAWASAKRNHSVFALQELIRELNKYRAQHPWVDSPITPENEKIELPVITLRGSPRYDEEARQKKIQGSVVINLVFTSAGQLTEFRVIQGLSYGLTARALDAVLQTVFKPGTREGKPISVRGYLTYNFKLR